MTINSLFASNCIQSLIVDVKKYMIILIGGEVKKFLISISAPQGLLPKMHMVLSQVQ